MSSQFKTFIGMQCSPKNIKTEKEWNKSITNWKELAFTKVLIFREYLKNFESIKEQIL